MVLHITVKHVLLVSTPVSDNSLLNNLSLLPDNNERLISAKDVRDNVKPIIESKLSIKDGGLVVEAPTGYTSLFTLTDDGQFVYKKWVEDLFNTLTNPISNDAFGPDWSGVTNVGASKNALYDALSTILNSWILNGNDLTANTEFGGNTGSDFDLIFKRNGIQAFKMVTDGLSFSKDTTYFNNNNEFLWYSNSDGSGDHTTIQFDAGSIGLQAAVGTAFANIGVDGSGTAGMSYSDFSAPANQATVGVRSGAVDIAATVVSLNGNLKFLNSSVILDNSDKVSIDPINGYSFDYGGTDPVFGLRDGTVYAAGLDQVANLRDRVLYGLSSTNVLDWRHVTLSGGWLLDADPTAALGIATKQYVDASVVGLWDDRGNYDASGSTFPSTGGSGASGAILKGDIWTISVAGTLGGTAVAIGDTVRAKINTPGSTAGNWAIMEHGLGYTPITNVLNSANILVGNSSNVAAAVSLTLNGSAGSFALSNTGVLTMPDAATATRGLLNSTDWNTFNNKQAALTNPVTGTGVAGQIAVWNGITSEIGYNGFVYDNVNGRIGSGIASPLTALHIQDQSSSDPRGILYRNFGASARIRLGMANGTIASPTIVTTGQASGIYAAEFYDGTNFVQSANIFAVTRGTISTGVMPTDLTFSTTTDAGVLQTAMVLGKDGRMGIGNFTIPLASFYLNKSETDSAWLTTGKGFRIASNTYTDTTSTGAPTAVYIHTIASPTYATSNTTTPVNIYTLNIESPTDGSGVTSTNKYALRVGGTFEIVGSLRFTGGARSIGSFDNSNFSIRTFGSDRIGITATGLQTYTQDALSSGTTAFITYTQAAHTGGAQPGLLWTAGALTSQTTATNITDINFNLSAVLKQVDGTTALMRGMLITGRTYTPQTTALTITNASTLDVVQSIAGSGTTITNNYAFRALFDSSNYFGLSMNNTGNATFNLVGTTPSFIFNQNIKLNTAGAGLYIKQGSNATCGRGTLVGGTLTVSTTKATSTSEIFITDRGGTITNLGTIYISAVSNGTSFTVTSTNLLDVSTFSWFIIESA